MTEESITKEALNFGTAYVQEKYKGAPLPDQMIAANAAAHGFYVGYKHALKEKESTRGDDNAART